MLHIFSIYGYTNAESDPNVMETNEFFLRDVFDAAAELGNVPVVLMGDFIVVPESSPTLQAALLTGVWRDAAVEVAVHNSYEPAPTCFPSASSAGRRIDAAFLNHVAAASLLDYCLLEDTGIPTHVPLSVEISLGSYGQDIWRLRSPRLFPVGSWAKWSREEEAQLCHDTLAAHSASWKLAAESSDVELMWEIWNQTAELYLAHRSSLDHATFNKFLGRGQELGPLLGKSSAHQVRGQLGAQVVCQRRLLRFTRRLEALLRQLKDPSRSPGISSHQTWRLWQNIISSTSCFDWPWFPSFSADRLPSVDDVAQVLQEIQSRTSSQAAVLRSERIRVWRE